jgi:hypothetical protein
MSQSLFTLVPLCPPLLIIFLGRLSTASFAGTSAGWQLQQCFPIPSSAVLLPSCSALSSCYHPCIEMHQASPPQCPSHSYCSALLHFHKNKTEGISFSLGTFSMAIRRPMLLHQWGQSTRITIGGVLDLGVALESNLVATCSLHCPR